MAVDKDWLVDIIGQHNDQFNPVKIIVLQGSSQSVIDTSRIHNPDKLKYPLIEIDGDDIVVKVSYDPPFGRKDLRHRKFAKVRTGLVNIDLVNYFEVGQEIDPSTGKPVVPTADVTVDEYMDLVQSDELVQDREYHIED